MAGTRGQAGRVVRLFGAAEGLIEAVGLPGHTYYQPARALYERAIAAARAQLGEAAWAVACVEGRTMTLEQTVEYALSTAGPPASG